jgi:hypothetical protein
VFPEPPPGHPLFDVEAQKRLQQFRDLASSLSQWIKEQTVVMQVSLIQFDYANVCEITREIIAVSDYKKRSYKKQR